MTKPNTQSRRTGLGKLLLAAALPLASAAGAQMLNSGAKPIPLLKAMVGTWEVDQQMATGPDAKMTSLPPAVAVRRIPEGGGFLVEDMSPARPGTDTFTRTSHINYNGIDGVFEYSSLDTRAPQQMQYQSQATTAGYQGNLQFKGGTFVSAVWGDQKNVAFAYRVDLSAVVNGRQTLKLYLRQLAAGQQREFVAFQYNYRRR